MNIAIIPARGGSKRIPKKNIKEFSGKPIIYYSINAAIQSKLFDEVVVSTDDNEIAEVALSYGAKVPFLRPKKLSDDYIGTHDVVKHAVNFLIENGQKFKYACCIYATAPLIMSSDLISAFEIMKKEKYLSVFSAAKYSFPIQRSFKLNKTRGVHMSFPDNFDDRSQDLDETYHDAGQFYWSPKKVWLQDPLKYNEDCFPFILPNWRVQDIDTMEDWKRAEFLYQILKES